jgi:hypothetical protein
MDGRTEPNEPNGLLAALVPYGVLVQPEVALTRGLYWLLGLEGAVGALDGLVRRNGVEPGTNGFWLTEVVGADRGRTDLEYRWGGLSGARVVVEAKIGHTLTYGQVAGYRSRLPHEGGLLVVLVPEARRLEGEHVVNEYRASNPHDLVHLDVWTYDDVTRALEEHLPENPDVAQFKGLVQASRALDIFPMDEAQLMDDNDTRRDDIWRVIDTASYGLFNKRLPSGSDLFFESRRFVELVPYSTSLSVGVGRKSWQTSVPRPWAWLRVSDTTTHARIAQTVLQEIRGGETSREADGIWVPLKVPAQATGAAMIQKVREQIEEIGVAAREALDEAYAADVTDAPIDLQGAIAAVLDVPPVEREDLLDGSDARKADIDLVVREAVRTLVKGNIHKPADDDDFASVRYLPVAPFDTNVAIAIGRKSHLGVDGAQPWAWLRVHNRTPHADIAFDVLEHLAPGRIVRDTLGRAFPLDIPAGVSGPRMLEVVCRQLQETIAAIRAAIFASHRED